MGREKVLVLYNEPVLPEGHPEYIAEVEVLDNVQAVETLLREAGYEALRLGITSDPRKLIDGIQRTRPDAVFNLFEGTADNNASELYAAGILEWLGVSYTGCSFHTLVLARSKHVAKRLFVAEGLPTASFVVVEKAPLTECALNFPLIVKPAQQDASVGVDQSSVVTDMESLNRRLSYVLEEFGPPVLVEEFIDGREVTYALVEMPDLRFLPATEVVFPDKRLGYWPVLTYDAKWTEESMEFKSTDYHFLAQLPAELEAEMEVYSRKAFSLLSCRDCARVDFRIRAEDNKPFILEVNPNPDFVPDRALSNNLWAAGLTHAEFTLQMVKNALARRGTSVSSRYRSLLDERQAG